MNEFENNFDFSDNNENEIKDYEIINAEEQEYCENTQISDEVTPTFIVNESDDIKNEEDFQRTDNYYMPSSENSSHSFYTTNSKPAKKKKYVSVKAAVVALIITSIISITGGALLSGISFSNGLVELPPSYNGTSVQDNINNSNNASIPVKHTSLSGEALTTPEIVDKVGPAVVGIINKTTYGNAYGYYGSLYGDLNQEIEQGSGSGVIISADGYIVTNNHVIENASALTVILNTGTEYKATVVGTDSSTDLAIIKIDAKNLAYAQMGSSSSLRVGESHCYWQSPGSRVCRYHNTG